MRSFVKEKEGYRLSIASKTVNYDRFECNGNYTLWVSFIKLV